LGVASQSISEGEDADSRRVSQWRNTHRRDRDRAAALSDDASSGSDGGLPEGFGSLAVKQLMWSKASRKDKSKHKAAQKRRKDRLNDSSFTHGSVDDDANMRDDDSVLSSDRNGSQLPAEGEDVRSPGGDSSGVRYQVRAMPVTSGLVFAMT
jgi:hypothetical protein